MTNEIPEGSFLEIKETENLIDETDGIHIVFGMVIVPYILYIVQNNKMPEINKVFSFLENMAMCEDVKVKEVLDFTILEQLADEGHDTLADVLRMLRQKAFLSVAMPKAIEFLCENVFAGEIYEGELLEKLSEVDDSSLVPYSEEVKGILEKALKNSKVNI